MNTYQTEVIIPLKATFTTATGAPVTPTAITLTIETPLGAIVTVGIPGLVNTGVGTYYYNYIPLSPGLYSYRYEADGVVQTAAESQFYVGPSLV